MAANSSNDWKESLPRWSRVCEMGMEAALREAGYYEWEVSDLLRTFEGTTNILPGTHMSGRLSAPDLPWERLIGTDTGETAVLATLGRRRDTLVKVIDVSRRSGLLITEEGAAALMVNISSNTNIQELRFEGSTLFGTVKGATLLGHAMATNSSIEYLDLQRVDLRCESVKCILNGMESNPNLKLKKLALRGNTLDDGVRLVAEFVKNNKTLEDLSIDMVGSHMDKAAIAMSLAVGANLSVSSLTLGVKGMRKKDMENLLKSLSGGVDKDGVISHAPKNSHITSLCLIGGNQEHVECISRLIRANKHLIRLQLLSFGRDKASSPLLPTDWSGHIFPALKNDCTLEALAVPGSEGLTEEVFKSLMDLLQNSTTRLKEINLSETSLEARQGQVNEELRINQEYRYQLRDQLRGEPQSAITSGRIVFCGYGFAGKTEITKTMKQTEEKGWMQIRLKNLAKKVGTKAHKQWAERTRGFQVVTLKKQRYIKSIWDFAGQKEYYALHDYVFPNNKNSHFLYVCSCRFPPDHSDRPEEVKDKEAIKSECEFWMRFVASNSKLDAVQGQKLPQVSFVLTKTDTITSEENFKDSMVEAVVEELGDVFKNVLHLDRGVEVVDSRSPEKVNCLLARCNQNLEQILVGQKEYDICQELRNLFEEWSRSNPKKPVLSLDEFHKLCSKQKKLHTFSMQGRKVFLAYLHDLGEIIFPKQSDYIVTTPTWFAIGVLGSLIEAFKEADMPSFKLHHEQGFVKRQAMRKHLESSLQSMALEQSIPAEKLIDLMVHLELCFQSEPEEDKKGKQKIEGGDSPFFVPALFDDKAEAAANGGRQLEWKLQHESGRIEHLGRRLECKDRSTTFLTPGFFPRLQVRLRNYLHEKNWTKNVFEVGRNLIRFAENGIEVCVEYAGDNDDFIDILVRSSVTFARALKFIEEHVVQTIRTFCASPQGCQGVILVESIIRPVCVKDLHLCIRRKPHSVLVSDLEGKLREDEAYIHTWSEGIDGESDVVLARDLVRGKDLSLETLSSTDDFPRHFYASAEDVSSTDKIVTRFNLTKLIPMKLHIQCQHGETCHPVKDQPGRRINLKDTAKGYDLNVAKLAITLLWAGANAAERGCTVSVAELQVGNWVQNLFKVDGLPSLDSKRLQELASTDKSAGPVSEKQVLKALKKYWEVDPRSQDLKEFLKLQDGKKFWEDFKLTKVIYTEGDDRGKVGWLCDEHFKRGVQARILRSEFH